MKNIAKLDFLTPEEIDRVQTLWRDLKDAGRFAAEVERQIIAPNRANAAASVRDHVHDLDDGDHGAMHQLCGGVTFVSSRRQSRAARSSLLLAWMYTIQRYGVVHLRFSVVFLPAATAQVHGCFSDRMRGPDCFVRAPAVW